MESICSYPFFQNNNKLNINYFENNLFNKESYNYKQIPNEEDYFENIFNLNDNSNYDDSTFAGGLLQIYEPDFLYTIPKPENHKIKFLVRKRLKPGKKIEDNQNNDNKKSYIHSKKKFDNILTKIQVSYINFLIDFINYILELYGRKDLKFRYLDSKIKKNNKSIIRRQQKDGNIGNIIKNKISSKFTTLDKNTNFQIYEELERSGLYEDILNILNQKFLFFFEKVYYNNIRKFNLKDFGLKDLKVELPENIKLYENLSFKNIKDADYEEYMKKMEECVKWHFLGGLEKEEINKIIKL